MPALWTLRGEPGRDEGWEWFVPPKSFCRENEERRRETAHLHGGAHRLEFWFWGKVLQGVQLRWQSITWSVSFPVCFLTSPLLVGSSVSLLGLQVYLKVLRSDWEPGFGGRKPSYWHHLEQINLESSVSSICKIGIKRFPRRDVKFKWKTVQSRPTVPRGSAQKEMVVIVF